MYIVWAAASEAIRLKRLAQQTVEQTAQEMVQQPAQQAAQPAQPAPQPVEQPVLRSRSRGAPARVGWLQEPV